MSEEKDKGGRPPTPRRLKKGKMVGARFTPHTVAQLRAYADEGESLTAALERLARETLDATAPAGARYFTADEARLAGFGGDLEGMPGKSAMRALPGDGAPQFWRVEVMNENTWQRLPGEHRLTTLPLHTQESLMSLREQIEETLRELTGDDTWTVELDGVVPKIDLESGKVVEMDPNAYFIARNGEGTFWICYKGGRWEVMKDPEKPSDYVEDKTWKGAIRKHLGI